MKKFEERLSRLEEISERIRSPDVQLEEAVALFEEGVKLSRGLEKDLEKVEGRVEILLNKDEAVDGAVAEMELFEQDKE